MLPRRRPVLPGGYASHGTLYNKEFLNFSSLKLKSQVKRRHGSAPLHGHCRGWREMPFSAEAPRDSSGLAGCQPTSAPQTTKPQGPVPILYSPQAASKRPSNPIRQQHRLSKEINQKETGKGKVTGEELCLKQRVSSLLP